VGALFPRPLVRAEQHEHELELLPVLPTPRPTRLHARGCGRRPPRYSYLSSFPCIHMHTHIRDATPCECYATLTYMMLLLLGFLLIRDAMLICYSCANIWTT